ncbi:MAG: glycosyltransferase family 2 protein [Planctomycetaceae bacterium]|nr:glycosyltransferase family 2 protein [Planctomycetaceae bacterium]
MKVSILVPAYNEQATIGIVLRKLMAVDLNDKKIGLQVDREIIVVDDGSSDGTYGAVEAFIQDHPSASQHIRLIRQTRNMADVVYGSRFLVKKASRVLYFYHYVANKFLTLLSNVLTNRNMSDIETCYKAFRREVIVPLEFTSKGFGMEVEITAMVCKTIARTYEVPISYYGRTYDEGKKIGVWDGIAAIWYILYYNLIHPVTGQGQAYIQTVNQSLRELHSRTPPGEIHDPNEI